MCAICSGSILLLSPGRQGITVAHKIKNKVEMDTNREEQGTSSSTDRESGRHAAPPWLQAKPRELQADNTIAMRDSMAGRVEVVSA